MERRKVLKIAAGTIAAGGIGFATLTTAFKPKNKPIAKPQKLTSKENESSWKYTILDPSITAELAYNEYPNGSCMYGVASSIITQLAEKIGEPFASFPIHMMKYGHGGVCGYGTICGALNATAAIMGLLITEKETRDLLVAELFHIYETTPLPEYKPINPGMNFTPPTSISESVLCHASTTIWGKVSGYRVDSKERKERCRRLTADIAAKTVTILNNYYQNTYVAHTHENETVNTCMTCHGKEGKLGNTSGKMTCTSCHTKSAGHKAFGDIHYKLMKKR